jgi:hypothetical protein
MKIGQLFDTVSLEYYRKNRRFIPSGGVELFCVTDDELQLMMPAIEDWMPIPIPKELGQLKFGDVIRHERDTDGLWRWYVENESEPRAIDEPQRNFLARWLGTLRRQ